MNNNETLKLGEFFCGPGGLALGAKQSSIMAKKEKYHIEHAWASDYDQDSCNTYIKNICPQKPETVICEDVRKIDFERLKEISDIDIFSFGFPCNDFSVVGEKKGINGNYGSLYKYGVKALKFFRPKFFVAENVGGLKTSNEGKTFSIILNDLYDAGYSLFPHLYKFNQYGVPQARQRIIIIGIRDDLNLIYKIPSVKPYENINVSSQNAIENPPILTDAYNHELTAQSEAVKQRLMFIKPGENAFTAQIPEKYQLKVNGAKISQIYKRLTPSKPAYTVTGSGGGGTHMYHWEENRALTNRERARLQTFPDNFVFTGSKESVRKQIGMAVPCKGAEMIFKSLLRTYAGVNYPSVDPNIDALMDHSKINLYNSQTQGATRLLDKQQKYKTSQRY